MRRESSRSVEARQASAGFHDYLTRIGLGKLADTSTGMSLNTVVRDAFANPVAEGLTGKSLAALYSYDVPKLSPDGTCSIATEKADKPYNLAATLGVEPQDFSTSPHTIRLLGLKQVIEGLAAASEADWVGVYRKVINPDGVEVLVKEAYKGTISRPEFPLTEEFAEHSNNSTVGLSGKAVVVEDVSAYEGPYYECDGKVLSEFCLPIFDGQNNVIGIIDAESFKKQHFTPDKLLQVAKVAYDLGEINLGIS